MERRGKEGKNNERRYISSPHRMRVREEGRERKGKDREAGGGVEMPLKRGE